MELGAGGNPARQLGLNIHVDIFQFRLPLEAVLGDLLADLCQGLADRLSFGWVSTPIFSSIPAWATDPAMSCFHSRQSKEMDSEKAATSAAGPSANLPDRETGEVVFICFKREGICGEHRGKSRRNPIEAHQSLYLPGTGC